MRRPAALLAVVLALAGCGGDDRRDAVSEYIEAANRVQLRSQPTFQRAERALREFGSQRGATPATAERLREVIPRLEKIRDELARLEPPSEAEALHFDLLRLLELQIDLSKELSVLAEYLPSAEKALAPPAVAGARLERALAGAETQEASAAALRSYARAVRGSLKRLEALSPPPVLEPWHEAQTSRLSSARTLALDVAEGIDAGDAKAVNRAVKAFRNAPPDVDAVNEAQKTAVDDFNTRVRAQPGIQERIRREYDRLNRELG